MDCENCQKQYGPKEYSLCDDALILPYKIKKNLKIYRNMLNLEDECYEEKRIEPTNKNSQAQQLPIPYLMSQTFIKYMLLYRLTAYLCVISILISLVDVYQEDQYNLQMLIYINNGTTVAIWVAMIFKFKLYWAHQISKKVNKNQYWDFWHLIDLILAIPHATIWTQEINYFLHLAIMFRIILFIKYVIYSSLYCDVRAYRIITTYGLHSKEHFFFSVKALVASLDAFQVLFIQFISLLYFTHGLYLISAAGQVQMQFMDCFEVIIVSVPTVGFGEYEMPYLGQKVLIFFILIIGAVFNSFITLTMLSQLDMSDQQLSSYWLMQKVETRENIENISKKFIQKSMGMLKFRPKNTEGEWSENQYIHYAFRNEYRLKKSLYNSISYTDITNLFTYFRESIIELRIISRQVDNMIKAFLRSLHHQKANNGKLMLKSNPMNKMVNQKSTPRLNYLDKKINEHTMKKEEGQKKQKQKKKKIQLRKNEAVSSEFKFRVQTRKS